MSGRESEWIQSNDKKQTKNNASRIKENMGISKLCFLSVEKKNNLFLFKIYENYNYFGMELDIYPANYQYFDNSSYSHFDCFNYFRVFLKQVFFKQCWSALPEFNETIILLEDFKTGISNNKLTAMERQWR